MNYFQDFEASDLSPIEELIKYDFFQKGIFDFLLDKE